MSSILKALKKLEKEPAAEVELGALPTALNTAEIFKKPLKERRLLGIVSLMIQVLLIASGASLFVLYLFHNQLGSPSIPVRNIDFAGEETATRSTSAHGVSVRSIALRERPVPASGLQTNATTIKSGRPDKDIPQGHAETNNSVTRIEITPAGDVLPTELTKAEPPLLLPRLDFSILRLQAVTWAVDPQDRFALVDGTILRKGDSIKGFAVDSIQEDHIVVGKGGEQWRVEFRLR